MSFIHYKLITNKTFEKITFDGVSLSVFDLKKIILEKKFRKQIAAPTPNGIMSTGSMPNKKNSDVDLEITNADTNEVYQNDTDLIPKNSRVRINRVVKTVGPAIAGGTITSTQKQKEQLVNLRERFNHYANSPSYGSSPNSSPLNDFSGNEQKPGDDSRDFSSMNEESNSNSSCSLPLSECKDNLESLSPLVNSVPFNGENKRVIARIKVTIPSQKIAVNTTESPPSTELLCPFIDESGSLHLIQNAVIVPCCGYLICCEGCIRERINKASFLECPHEGCIQEITSNHRLTPYKPIRQKVIEYLNRNPAFAGLKTVPTSMVVIQPIQPSSTSLTDLTPSSPSSFTPVKLNLSKPATPESSPVQALADHLQTTEENTSDKERTRSLSRSGSSRSTSRSRSSSSSSRLSSKSSTESVKTPLQSEEVVSSADKIRRTPTPTVSEPVLMTEQVQVQSVTQQQANVYVNQTQHFNGQPFYGQEQQMFYNQQNIQPQQQNYYRNYIPPQSHHVNQHMPGFGNFTKQVAPPPGTEHFIQAHFQQQQHHQQYHSNFNQQPFNINQQAFPGQFPPIHQPPGYMNGGFPMNQYNQQWPNQQLPMQHGIINAPIKITSTHRHSYNQRQTFHPENRSRSRSRSRHAKKHKRKYSRDRRSRSRDRRSRSRNEKRSRVDTKKSSYRSRRSRSRSRSHHKSDSVKTSGVNKEATKTNGSYKSSKSSKRSRSKSRDRHAKKSSRDERKEERRQTKPERELVKNGEEQAQPAKLEAEIKNSTNADFVEEEGKKAEASVMNKVINLKSSAGASSASNGSSACSSPSKSTKSKRKVFLRHEILQQALQNSSPQKLLLSKETEDQMDTAKNDLEEVNPISPIAIEEGYNAGSSADQTVNEYEEYLDINVSENLSLA